eukprot:1006383_1
MYCFGWNQKYTAYSMLNTIRSVTQSSHPITFSGINGFWHCTLRINSKRLSNTMALLLDCDPRRKTFDLKFPHFIEPEYLSSIIRGIVDGDGCWSIFSSTSSPRVTLSIASANQSFLDTIKSVINKFCLNTTEDRGTISQCAPHCYTLIYCDVVECRTIGEWMYQSQHIDDGMFLHKKLSRYRLLRSFGERGSIS